MLSSKRVGHSVELVFFWRGGGELISLSCMCHNKRSKGWESHADGLSMKT
jgi:hypothetical protein